MVAQVKPQPLVDLVKEIQRAVRPWVSAARAPAPVDDGREPGSRAVRECRSPPVLPTAQAARTGNSARTSLPLHQTLSPSPTPNATGEGDQTNAPEIGRRSGILGSARVSGSP